MNKSEKLILITNDDSYRAKGIKELVDMVKHLGRVVVVAPRDPMSAKSHAITVDEPLWLKKIKSEQNEEWYHLNGTPADCVKFAIHEILQERRPDIVLSGINHGPNNSVSQFYSGTVSAAVEGTLNGIPSIAFSVNNFMPDAKFSHAKEHIIKITSEVLEKSLPAHICLNVNFPKGANPIKGLKVCRQTRGKWEEKFIKQEHPYRGNFYWLSGTFTNFEPKAGDNDVWAVENDYTAVLPIDIDITAYKFMDDIRDWEQF